MERGISNASVSKLHSLKRSPKVPTTRSVMLHIRSADGTQRGVFFEMYAAMTGRAFLIWPKGDPVRSLQ